MSYSKSLLQFNFDVLYYLNRDELERFSVVCCLFKNFIERYFNTKPYRMLDQLDIRRGLYALVHNNVQWHPKRADYSVLSAVFTFSRCVQRFLAGQRYSGRDEYYSFAEMRPYLGPNVRIKQTIHVVEVSTYNPEHITEMESIAYLWRNGNISVWNAEEEGIIGAENFQLVLNSPSILQCRHLYMEKAYFSYSDCKILYTINIVDIDYFNKKIDPDYWPQFLEQPGVKPIVVLRQSHRESVNNLLERCFKAFFFSVSPNAFKIVFNIFDIPLTEFQETNKTLREKLELKKCVPVEYRHEYMKADYNYTLERSSI